MNFIINVFNNKNEIILSSVISSLTTLLVISLIKFLFIKIRYLYKQFIFFFEKKNRQYKGKLTVNELLELERKQNNGEKLTKKEILILTKSKEKIRNISKITF